MTDKIYVVGHKSPDTDSVTSAITYANLKNALGMKEAVAAAAGDINAETKFLLDYFKVPYPEKLTDATDKKVILVDHNEMAQAVLKKNRKKLTIDPASREPAEALKAEFEGSVGKLAPLRERIEGTDGLIDAIVYRLYGLTDEEIAIVEGRETMK